MSSKAAPEGKLSADERRRLGEYRGTITRGLASEAGAAARIGEALAAIRDANPPLYRETHHSFQAFCRAEWGMAPSTAYGYIEHAEVTRHVGTSLHLSVGHTHAIAPLGPDKQKKLASEIVAGKLTVRQARRLAIERKGRKRTGGAKPAVTDVLDGQVKAALAVGPETAVAAAVGLLKDAAATLAPVAEKLTDEQRDEIEWHLTELAKLVLSEDGRARLAERERAVAAR